MRGKGSVELGVAALPSVGVAAIAPAFPSPCGERVLLNELQKMVSAITKRQGVSVPLRGKGSVEPKHRAKLGHDDQLRFPSPCGERVLLNGVKGAGLKSPLGSFTFPSPCGERVLLNKNKMPVTQENKRTIEFPSPCGERVLLNALAP